MLYNVFHSLEGLQIEVMFSLLELCWYPPPSDIYNSMNKNITSVQWSHSREENALHGTFLEYIWGGLQLDYHTKSSICRFWIYIRNCTSFGDMHITFLFE